MGEYTSKTKTSDNSCSSSLMLVAFRLGFLQATCNQILAKVGAMQTPAAPPSGPETSWLSRMKDHLDRFETLQRVWRKGRELYKSGPWTFLGWCGYMLGRKLGLW